MRKGHVRLLCHSQLFKTRVTPPKGWDVKGGIPLVTKRWNTGPAQKLLEKCNEIVFGMCTVLNQALVYVCSGSGVDIDRKFIWHATDGARIPCVLHRKNRFVPTPPQSPCVSSSCNMGFGLDETVNFHVMRPTAPGFRIFRGKCALYQTPQIRCVFSNKMRLGFNVIVNLYVMRPTAPKFIVFFQKMRFAISL